MGGQRAREKVSGGQRGGRLRPGGKGSREVEGTSYGRVRREKIPSEQEPSKGSWRSWRVRKKAGHLNGLAGKERKVGEGRSESEENCSGQGNRKGWGSWRLGRKRNLLTQGISIWAKVPIALSSMNALLWAGPGGEPHHRAAP